MKTTLLLAALPILLVFPLAGCDESDNGDPTDPGDGHPPAEMVGTWIFRSVTVDGAAVALPAAMDWNPQTTEARLHVQANSAYVYDEVNAAGGQLWVESGFIFIDGDELDLNIQQDSDGPVSETVRVAWTLQSGTLTLSMDDEGSIVVFVLTM